MKSISFLLLVTVFISGCASHKRKPIVMPPMPPMPAVRKLPTRPPMPPMPPARVAATRTFFMPASTISTSVDITGPINIDVNLWVYFVYATQLATNELFIQQSGEPTFATPINGAIWSCYPVQQDVLAMFNAQLFSTSFFRSLNVPCEWTPPVALSAPTSASTALSPKLQSLRHVNARGVVMKIDRELPLVNGVRRFTLTQAK